MGYAVEDHVGLLMIQKVEVERLENENSDNRQFEEYFTKSGEAKKRTSKGLAVSAELQVID